VSRFLDAHGLSIGTVAGRTGVSVPVLRAWERRYGFPVPMRSASGHRRYRERDIDLIARVVRDRSAGLSLEAAIDRVRDLHERPPSSILAGLRRYGFDPPVHLVTKVSMLAISRAIEDECCARADRPILVAAFQRDRHFRQSERRWRDLARTAALAVVFAEFPADRKRPAGPASVLLEVHLGDNAPLLREWALVCDAPDSAAVLVGRERPGQEGSADRTRLFEAAWGVEPTVVRQAARIGLELARQHYPGPAGNAGPAADLQRVADELTADPEHDPVATARRATALANRVVAYQEHYCKKLYRPPSGSPGR
jgi:DICT domain-containing protein